MYVLREPEQLSFLPAGVRQGKDCFHCQYFAELKMPFKRSDGAVIYGYCFHGGDQGPSPGMGKGLAVFLPEGYCKRFRPMK